MLTRQNRRRHHDSDLPAAQHRSGGGAKRGLGLAETDVAAHQPVHWVARFQVGEDVLDGARLIGGRDERESGHEALVFPRRRVELRGIACFALIGKPDQAMRGFGNLPADLGAPLLPAFAIKAVERHRFRVGAISPEQPDLLDRHHQRGAARVLDPDRLLCRHAVAADSLNASQQTDAVLDLDYRVVHAEGCLRAAPSAEAAAAPSALRVPAPAAKQIRCSDHGHILGGQHEAGIEIHAEQKRFPARRLRELSASPGPAAGSAAAARPARFASSFKSRSAAAASTIRRPCSRCAAMKWRNARFGCGSVAKTVTR